MQKAKPTLQYKLFFSHNNNLERTKKLIILGFFEKLDETFCYWFNQLLLSFSSSN